MGNLLFDQGQFTQAAQQWQESRLHRERLGDDRGVAMLVNKLGNAAFALEQFADAQRLHEESYARSMQLDYQWGMATSQDDLGICALQAGESATAIEHHEHSLATFTALGEPWGIAHAEHNLGRSELAQGNVQRASELMRLSLARFRDLGEKHLLSIVLCDLARLALARGQADHATRLLGAADRIREAAVTRLGRPDQQLVADAISRAKELIPQSFETAWRQGRAMRFVDAVDLALLEVVGNNPGGSPKAQLTRREREVADLVAVGMTNQEIAGQLVITLRTAETHLENIYVKLGVRNRTALTRWVMKGKVPTDRH
jgi:ATP/maltotriose-dependent transcriptional regulator MalT